MGISIILESSELLRASAGRVISVFWISPVSATSTGCTSLPVTCFRPPFL